MHGIGIVGMGIMGRQMARAIHEHPGFHVAAAFDPRRPFDDLGIVACDDAAGVIEDAGVDAVYIASPPASHRALIERCVAAGKPIFCEKPLATDSADADACAALAARAGVVAAVNFPFATAPAAVRLGELVATGALGGVERASLRLRFRTWPRDWQGGASDWLAAPAEGGFVREVMSHFVFLARRLFGEAELLGARVERNPTGVETAVAASAAFGGVPVAIDAAVAGEIDDDNRFEVVGSGGSAALTRWYDLDHAEPVTDRRSPIETQLAALDRMLDSDPRHGLASFDEAAAVVAFVESLRRGN